MNSHVIVDMNEKLLAHTRDVITNYKSLFTHAAYTHFLHMPYIDTGTQYVCLFVVLDFLNCDPVSHKKVVAGVHT